MNDKDLVTLAAALLLPGVQRSDPKARAAAAVEQAQHLIAAVDDAFAKTANELAAAQAKVDELSTKKSAAHP